MSGPYDASAFCRIQELYERAAVITHSQWDRDAGSRQHFNPNTNEPTQISEQEQVHVNGLGVSAAGKVLWNCQPNNIRNMDALIRPGRLKKRW